MGVKSKNRHIKNMKKIQEFHPLVIKYITYFFLNMSKKFIVANPEFELYDLKGTLKIFLK